MYLDFPKLKAEAEQNLIQSATLDKARYVQQYHKYNLFILSPFPINLTVAFPELYTPPPLVILTFLCN